MIACKALPFLEGVRHDETVEFLELQICNFSSIELTEVVGL